MDRRKEEFLRMAQSIKADASIELPEQIFPDVVTKTIFGDSVHYILAMNHEMLEKIRRLKKGDCFSTDLFNKEVAYQYLDFETRRRGYFVKGYLVLDYKHVVWTTTSLRLGMSVMPEIREISYLSKYMYPQMEAAVVLANSSMATWIMKIGKPFISESAFEKFRVEQAVPVGSIDGLCVIDPIGTPCRTDGWRAVSHMFMRDGVDVVQGATVASQERNQK